VIRNREFFSVNREIRLDEIDLQSAVMELAALLSVAIGSRPPGE
jgi:hypothetical protein